MHKAGVAGAETQIETEIESPVVAAVLNGKKVVASREIPGRVLRVAEGMRPARQALNAKAQHRGLAQCVVRLQDGEKFIGAERQQQILGSGAALKPQFGAGANFQALAHKGVIRLADPSPVDNMTALVHRLHHAVDFELGGGFDLHPGDGRVSRGAVQGVEPAISRQQWIGFDLDRSIGRGQRIDDVLVHWIGDSIAHPLTAHVKLQMPPLVLRLPVRDLVAAGTSALFNAVLPEAELQG